MRRNQLGASLVEFAMAFGLLLLFLGGIVDLSRWLLLTRRATTVAFEGARYASTLPSLEVTSADTSKASLGCLPISCPNQLFVITRMVNLFSPEELAQVNGAGVTLISSRTKDATQDPPDTVDVEVKLPFQPIILRLPELDSAIGHAKVAYLLND